MPFVELFKAVLGLDDISAGVLSGMLIILLAVLIVYGANAFKSSLTSSNKSQEINAGSMRDQTGVQLQALNVTERIIEKSNESNQKRDERVAKSLDRVADALSENSRSTNLMLGSMLTHVVRVDERTQVIANGIDDTKQGTQAIISTVTLFGTQMTTLSGLVETLLNVVNTAVKQHDEILKILKGEIPRE